MTSKKVLIIGDSCKDEFIYCSASRLAPDLPVPVLQVVNIESNPGMAANVYRNVKKKVSSCDLFTNDNWDKILKTRYVHQETNHMFLRVDSEATIKPIDTSKLSLEYELIVISDYNKGFLKEEQIQWICENHSNVFLDTKKILGSWAQAAKIIKINDFEYRASEPFVNTEIRNKIIRTRGPSGCDFRDTNYPVDKVEIRDTSGAGDSFMAALVVEYLSTSNIEISIRAANQAASKVVKTRGVSEI